MSHFQLRSPKAERVARLRALASNNTFPEEAQAATAKADDLMEKHELSEDDLVETEVDPMILRMFGWRE